MRQEESKLHAGNEMSKRSDTRHGEAPEHAWDSHTPPKRSAGKQANARAGSVTSTSGSCSTQHDTGNAGAVRKIKK